MVAARESGQDADVAMADTSLALSIAAASTAGRKSSGNREGKSRELLSFTVGQPPFAYAQVEVVTAQPAEAAPPPEPVDVLQFRSYCSAALRQFMGASAAGMPIDLLHTDGGCIFWVRLPREDLTVFAAALTAWMGASRTTAGGKTPMILRLLAAGNWLGSLVGQSKQEALWDST